MVKPDTAPVFISRTNLKKEWIWVGTVIGLLVLAEFVGMDRYLRRVGETVLNPVMIGAERVVAGVAWPWMRLQSLTTAQRRIQDLEFRYAEASAQLGEMNALQKENEALRNLLNTNDIKLEQRFITTPIIAYGKPLIAGGAEEGVREGAMVLVAQTLVGRIGAVSERQSEVELLSRATTAPILARTESGVEGLVRGDDKRVLLTEIPTNVELKVGERVVTQGQEGVAPNIFIGRIASLNTRPESAVQTAVLEQLVSFYQTNVVEVR